MINTIILGHALNVLPKLPSESVNCVVTSPPYWGLRDYGVDPVIWDGDKNCKHKWVKGKVAGDIRFRGKNSIVGNERNLNIYPIKHRPNETNPGKESWYKDKGGLSKNPSQSNFCLKCGAWKGSLGLEPTFELYVKHLCDIFDEVKRVLRKDGTCFIDMGDSYGGSQGKNAGWPDSKTRAKVPQQLKPKKYAKCLLDIPYRFSIEMTNRGWIKRNTLIWWKPNCMPSSAPDRFTIDFEYLFFFTKNNKAIFWTNEKTLECVSKKPLGIKGIEKKDWEWRKCTTCQGTGQIVGKALKEGTAPRLMKGIGIVDKNTKAFKICPRCKGSGKVKYSFWTGHDYWFEQQFEELKLETIKDKRTVNGYKNIRGRSWDKDPNSMFGKMGSMKINPQGRNKRCVWIISTQPFPEAHFAVYPEELIEIPIRAGCPEFVCKKCGKARVKIIKTDYIVLRKSKIQDQPKQKARINSKLLAEKPFGFSKCAVAQSTHTEIGYTDCGCNAGFEPGVTLDPFMGSGTTAKVALKQRKRFIGIEIKKEYIDMSYKRIARVQQRFF